MNKPKISVLMGVYNGSKHVQSAMLSILAQDYQEFEFIIINDGSTDDSLRKIKAINDPRIVIIDQKNQGLTKSLNHALSIAKGEYIARQDADDISLSSRFTKQIREFEKTPELGMLGSSMYISNSKGTFNEIFHYPCQHHELKKAVFSFNPFIHGAMMIKKDILLQAGGYNEDYTYVQDYELWSRLIFTTTSANLPEPLYARLREDDCSETSVDKSSYVNAIQKSLQAKESENNEIAKQEIKAQSIYPYLGLPILYCKPLSRTYRNIAQLAKHHQLLTNYQKLALKYFPWGS